MMGKGIFLHNTVSVDTDSFGSWREQSVRVGFTNYGDEGKHYYSYDEVEELLKNGFVDDNISRDKEGNLYLKTGYCSCCKAFNVVCGRVIEEVKEVHEGLYNYCKKIGLVHDEFVDVEGWFGTKSMSCNVDGTYNIIYKIKSWDRDRCYIELLEKICVGMVKRVAGIRNRIHGKDGITIKKVFECRNVSFNRDTLELLIEGVDSKYVCGEIVGEIVSLDLELWMLYNTNKYWNRFYSSSVMVVRDMGQQHWFNGFQEVERGGDEHSNIDWYDRVLGSEWK